MWVPVDVLVRLGCWNKAAQPGQLRQQEATFSQLVAGEAASRDQGVCSVGSV